MSSSMEIFKKSEEGILKVIFSLILLFTNLKVTQCNQHYQDPGNILFQDKGCDIYIKE